MLANMLENVRGLMLEGMLTNGSHRLTINEQPTPLDAKVMCLDTKGLCLGIKVIGEQMYT